MERHDYLIHEIDALAKAIAKLLAALSGIKGKGKADEVQEMVSEALEKSFKLSISALLAIPVGYMIETLQASEYTSVHWEQWANVLLLLANELHLENPFCPDSAVLYEKCLEIYEHLNTYNDTYSYNTHLKIERIKKLGIVGK